MLNKLQQKAFVFKCIESVRNAKTADDSTVTTILEQLTSNKELDFEFAAKILIKEFNPKNQKIASAFLYMAENLAPESFIGFLTSELNSNSVSDSKKIFIINILSSMGMAFSPDDISLYLKNPDEAISQETTSFVEKAMKDPITQIDFIDFYLSSSEQDKNELMNSILEDFSGDNLANILSPLSLAVFDTKTILKCIDKMGKTNSLAAIKPAYYLSKLNNPEISKPAERLLRKMQMKGLYTEEKFLEYSKQFLSDYKETSIIITPPDGNSNFTFIVSKKTYDNIYSALFCAFNTETGPFSSYGFNMITQTEHDSILRRFLSETKNAKIPIGEAKKIMTELTANRIKMNRVVPYEYFCWEKLIDDIKPDNRTIDEILEKDLKEEFFDIKDINLSEIEYIQNWFYRYTKKPSYYSDFIKKVMSCDIENLNKIEEITEEYSKNKEVIKTLRIRLKFLAYFVKNSDEKQSACLFYSIAKNNNALEYFAKYVLRKTIYEHVLNIMEKEKNASNIKTVPDFGDNKKVKFYLDYIEKNWVGE